jgi:hypothetical protein
LRALTPYLTFDGELIFDVFTAIRNHLKGQFSNLSFWMGLPANFQGEACSTGINVCAGFEFLHYTYDVREFREMLEKFLQLVVHEK